MRKLKIPILGGPCDGHVVTMECMGDDPPPFYELPYCHNPNDVLLETPITDTTCYTIMRFKLEARFRRTWRGQMMEWHYAPVGSHTEA